MIRFIRPCFFVSALFAFALSAIGKDFTATELNTTYADQTDVALALTEPSTLTLDVDLTCTKLTITGSANLTIKGTGDDGKTKPSETELAKLDVSGVTGSVMRTYLTKDVYSFNFYANEGTDASTALVKDDNWASDASSKDGSSTSLVEDGLSKLTWSCSTLWTQGSKCSIKSFLKGYLDDGSGGITIRLSAVPFETYDLIIYCESDHDSKPFTSKTVNGITYTYDSSTGYAKSGSGTWGNTSTSRAVATNGVNTIVIPNLSGPLTITSKQGSGANSRGCIAAIQITKPLLFKPTSILMADGTETSPTKWNTASNWSGETVVTNGGTAVVYPKKDAVVDLDVTVTNVNLDVMNDYVLALTNSTTNVVNFSSVNVRRQAKVTLKSQSGVTIGSINKPVYNDYKATSLRTRSNGNIYLQGAGALGALVEIPRNGGSITLTGGKDKVYYLKGDHAYTETSFIFDNTTVDYDWDRVSVGIGSYVLNNADVKATRFILSDGSAGRNARFTMNGTSSVVVTGSSIVDSNQNDIMFGHWAGPSTFTLNDESTFTATNTQVLVGKTGDNQTININGGTFTTKGIKVSGGATGTNKLNLKGGTLVLGDIGITTYNASRKMTVTVGGDATIEASTTTLPISQAIIVNEGKTLTIKKAAANTNETVSCTISGAISGAGTIVFGEGVNVNFGTARCAANDTTIEVASDAKVSMKLAYVGETIIFKGKNFKKENVTLSGTDGTALSDASVTVAEDGTVTVREGRPCFIASQADADFADKTCWTTGAMPTSGDITIYKTTTDDVTIAVPSACAFTNVYFQGSGKIGFKLAEADGATLSADGATLQLQTSGLTLVIDGVANTSYAAGYKNTIKGSGKVETYGDVKFTKDSRFTGGLTVKTGTTSSTAQDGFGGDSDDKVAGNITVEDGATLDLANTKDRCYVITIAGKGVATTNADSTVSYAGALTNTGDAIGDGARQLRKLTLSGDATITAKSGKDWSILNASYSAATLNLDGHTLTKQGAGEFKICNVSGSAGTLVIAEGRFTVIKKPSSLGDDTIKIMAGADIYLGDTLTVSSLQFYPDKKNAAGVNRLGKVTAGEIRVYTTGIELTEEEAADTTKSYALVTEGMNDTTPIIKDGFAKIIGGRFKPSYAANNMSLTGLVQFPEKFLHYDFNEETVDASQTATDSKYETGAWGEKEGDGPFIVNRGRTGTSAHVFYNSSSDCCAPYWTSLSSGYGFQEAGVLTVTTVARVPKAATTENVPLWGLGSTKEKRAGFGLVAINKTTVALVSWDNESPTEVCRVTDIPDLSTSFHFFAIVLDGTKATLYVDKRDPVEGHYAMPALAAYGQIGGFHGGVIKTYSKPSATGIYLDDWAIYEAALFKSEINALRMKYAPTPFMLLVE